MKTTEIKEQVVSGKYDALIEDLYADPSLLDYQKQRYAAALDKYQTLFGDDEVSIYSAAGRSEISGNQYRPPTRLCTCRIYQFRCDWNCI